MKYQERIMSNDQSFSLKEFFSANSSKQVSEIDYLHAISYLQKIPADFIVCFAKFFWPNFEIKDEQIYISELFDINRYEILLKEKNSLKEIQFWMNLVEITGLFNNLTSEQALEFGEYLIANWNLKLISEFKVQPGLAQVIYDEETHEVFVTIGSIEDSAQSA